MASPDKVFVMDNGAASIKAGFASDDSPQVLPNCKMKVKSERQRQYIGDQIEDCKDCSGLYYILPHQKGFIFNWDVEREIWDYIFKSKFKTLDPKDTDIIITEPYFNFAPVQNVTDEVLFEEHGFKSVTRVNTGYLSSLRYKSTNSKIDMTTDLPTTDDKIPLACVVVDSGFSFTHISPYIHHDKYGFIQVAQGIRRIDIGGKALTNYLKEIISYRQINVMDETHVINQCKEDICFVAPNFTEYLKQCEQSRQNSIARDYILPDFTNVKRGYVRKPDWSASTRLDRNSTDPQFVRLANERFQVPEILFNPSDIGVSQVGIVEAIIDAVETSPKQVRPLMYANVILTGGNTNIPGFRDRILQGIRSYCPDLYQVNVFLPDNPITYPWFGGKVLATDFSDTLKQIAITKKQHEES